MPINFPNTSLVANVTTYSYLGKTWIWNVALTDSDFISMSKGISCTLVRPQNLVFYAPLVRDLIDISKTKLALTNNGGVTVADHPRIYI